MLKGKRLVKGSKIGIVAPANSADIADVEKARKKLEELGYVVELGKACTSKWHSFAGTDEVRAADINEMFADSSIDGIMAMRGGYGSIRLLDRLDYDMIRSNPKVFIGFSDITSLHSALNNKCNLITFHGPMAVSNVMGSFDEVTADSFYKAVSEENKGYKIENPSGEKIEVLRQGSARGQIVGGNLAVMVSTLGTEYEVDTKGKILFIEEIGEHTYRVDRMLMQLKQAKKFDEAAGIIFGDFNNCEREHESDFSLEEVLDNVLKGQEKPIVSNLKSGHCKPMLTIPFGAEVELETENLSIKVVENTVE